LSRQAGRPARGFMAGEHAVDVGALPVFADIEPESRA
jgi:hypothetical protein